MPIVKLTVNPQSRVPLTPHDPAQNLSPPAPITEKSKKKPAPGQKKNCTRQKENEGRSPVVAAQQPAAQPTTLLTAAAPTALTRSTSNGSERTPPSVNREVAAGGTQDKGTYYILYFNH